MANRYWVGGTASWDGTAGSKWATSSGGAGGSAVPTSSDDVFFDANSGAVTVTKSTSGDCLSLNFTGYTGTFTLGANLSMYGSLTLVAAMTLTRTGGSLFFKNTTSQTITTNGKAIPIAVDMQMNGGTLTFQDDVVLTGTGGPGQWLHEQGTVDFNDFDLTCSGYYCSGSSTRSVLMKSGTLTITGSNNDGFFNMSTTTNLTFDAGTSTIKATDSSATLKTFQGGGLTFYNLWVATGSTGLFTITGANTFNNLRADAGRTVQFPQSTTQTVASVTFIGTAGNEIILKSSGPAAGGVVTYTEINAGSGYSNFDTVTLVGGDNNATFTYVFGSWNPSDAGTGYTAGVTYNVTGGAGSGAQFRPDTVTGAPTWTISDASGTNAVEYCEIENSIATGGASWNAPTGDGNVDNGGNTGWNFSSSTDYPLTASVTAYTLTMQNTNILRTWSIVTSVTAFTFTTIDAIISRAHGYLISTAVTAYNLTTQSAIITRMWAITTSVTTYALTTVDSIITRSVRLVASVASYLLSMIPTDLIYHEKDINFPVAVATYVITNPPTDIIFHQKYTEEPLQTNSFVKGALPVNTFTAQPLQTNSFTKEPLANT